MSSKLEFSAEIGIQVALVVELADRGVRRGCRDQEIWRQRKGGSGGTGGAFNCLFRHLVNTAFCSGFLFALLRERSV